MERHKIGAMYLERNIETRSYNHSCSGKERSIIYSVSVYS